MPARNMHQDRYEHYYAVTVAYTKGGVLKAQLVSFQFSPRSLTHETIYEADEVYTGRQAALGNLAAAVLQIAQREQHSRRQSSPGQGQQLELPF